jgi:hypothetical protein
MSRKKLRTVFGALLLPITSVLLSTAAHAQDRPTTAADPAAAPAAEPAPAPVPEPAPAPAPAPRDARGLEEKATNPDDVGLFVPRVVLFPVRLVTQGVFFPIRHGLRYVQRHALVERVVDILYNDERTAAIVPTFQFISAYGPTIGAKAFHENLAGHGEKGELSAQGGGLFNLAAEAAFSADRVNGSRLYVSSLVRWDSRPRLLFEGIGDQLPEYEGGGRILDPREASYRTRFSQDRLLLAQGAGYTIGQPGNLVKIGGAAIFNRRTFGPNTTEETSIEQVYDTSKLVGFREGATTLELDATLTIDTRDSEGQTSSGMFVDAFAGGVVPLQRYSYGHYGFEATGYIDLYRQTRVLVVRGGIEAVEGGDDDIPFAALPRLGGPTRLRGYRLDRFRDEKSALATVEYQYPNHEMIGGALFVDAGHVGKDYGKLVDLPNWRLGVGAGVRVRSKEHSLFSLDFAYGNDGVLVFFTSTPLRAFSNRERQL